MDEQGWAKFSRAWSTTVITALIAYFAWEAVRFATERHIRRPALATPGQSANLEGAQVSGSRFETLAPILRLVLGIAIVITAVMMMLTSLGINIMPLSNRHLSGSRGGREVSETELNFRDRARSGRISGLWQVCRTSIASAAAFSRI
jgi:hypothetical protein